MKWDKEAKEVVDSIPMPEIMKNMTILYAEKLARKNKKAEVSMEEVVQTRDDYFELFGDTLMKRLKAEAYRCRCRGQPSKSRSFLRVGCPPSAFISSSPSR